MCYSVCVTIFDLGSFTEEPAFCFFFFVCVFVYFSLLGFLLVFPLETSLLLFCFCFSFFVIIEPNMTDFPSKVTTETGSPNSQNTQQGGNSLRGLAANVTTSMDMPFIRSIPSVLMMAQIFLGLLHWALIAGSPYMWAPANGWVLFVAVTFWLLTSILFALILFGVQRRLTAVPWPLTVMVYHGVATILYLTAFLANAASVQPFYGNYFFGHMAAAAFFGAVVTLAYSVSVFFSFLDWRGDGGNAATSTVPT
ncbi:plasmolipin isoform X2 [Vanacampus margaritifer]